MVSNGDQCRATDGEESQNSEAECDCIVDQLHLDNDDTDSAVCIPNETRWIKNLTSRCQIDMPPHSGDSSTYMCVVVPVRIYGHQFRKISYPDSWSMSVTVLVLTPSSGSIFGDDFKPCGYHDIEQEDVHCRTCHGHLEPGVTYIDNALITYQMIVLNGSVLPYFTTKS